MLNFLFSNALLRFKKYISLTNNFYQKVYKTEINPYKKCFTFCKRLFIVKCFADVLNNIFRKLKKKKKGPIGIFYIQKAL